MCAHNWQVHVLLSSQVCQGEITLVLFEALQERRIPHDLV